jgi:hypothetical protein
MEKMIRCHYTRKTIDMVAKAGRYRAIGCGGFLYGWLAMALVGITIQEPAIWFQPSKVAFTVACVVGFIAMTYFFHRLHLNIEKTTLEHAGDEITLDDDEIRLVTADGTQITLPREGLRVQGGYYAAGNVTYRIWNPKFSKDKIILTSDMENAEELVETIRPGAWDNGSG